MSDGNGCGNGHGDGAALPAVRRGRPKVFGAEVQEMILGALAKGSYLDMACRAAGITRHCYYWWRRRWLDGDPDAQEYAEFFTNVKRAIAVGEITKVDQIAKAAEAGQWQASAWFLERRWPEHWGRKDTVTVKGAKRDLSNLSDDDLNDLARRRRRR